MEFLVHTISVAVGPFRDGCLHELRLATQQVKVGTL